MQLWAEKHITGTRHSLLILGDPRQLAWTMQYFQMSSIFRKSLQLKLLPKNIASSRLAAPGFLRIWLRNRHATHAQVVMPSASVYLYIMPKMQALLTGHNLATNDLHLASNQPNLLLKNTRSSDMLLHWLEAVYKIAVRFTEALFSSC